MARYTSTTDRQQIEVQHEKSVRHDLRFVIDLENMGVTDSDEVYLHLTGKSDVQIKLGGRQLYTLLKGDPRQQQVDDVVPANAGWDHRTL